MKLLVGLYPPQDGEILYNGHAASTVRTVGTETFFAQRTDEHRDLHARLLELLVHLHAELLEVGDVRVVVVRDGVFQGTVSIDDLLVLVSAELDEILSLRTFRDFRPDPLLALYAALALFVLGGISAAGAGSVPVSAGC